MPTITPDEVVWSNDGHTIMLHINKENLEVLEVSCPHDPEFRNDIDPDAVDTDGDGYVKPCMEGSRVGCVVKYFVNLYGLECNIGSCAPEPVLEISWCLQGSVDDIDLAQLWFVPIQDEVFYAWMTQRT